MAANADRNLLFGVLAIQMDFITRDQLLSAMNAWVFDKARPLGELLLRQQALSPDTHALLDALVQRHLALHDNDSEKSLAAVSSVGDVKRDLATIYDVDVHASLVQLSKGRSDASSPQTANLTGSERLDPYATTGHSKTGLSKTAGLRFSILRPLAQGGLGEVFAAHDEELHREVALKQIRPQHADSVEARSRFVLEAEITGGLEHPGIVPVYGLGQYADGRPFYAMRFIRGDSLKEAIERYHADPSRDHQGTGRPTPRTDGRGSDRAVAFRKLLGRLIDVCEAIQYAHDRGVLHRDLKPGNIMLGKYGETLVVDWGLAKAGVAGQESGARSQKPEVRDTAQARASTDEAPLLPASSGGGSETMQGAALGTPNFMSPEQAAGRLDEIGAASDVYSLGATLYTLLTAKPPVEGDDTPDILRRVREGRIRRPREVAPDVDPALEAVCMKALALMPAHRYASPRALADDLERWLADKPVCAWREPIVVRAKRWARQHQTLVTSSAASVFIALITVAAGLHFYQDAENRRAKDQADRKHEENMRELEAERKRTAAAEAIKNALDQAEKPRHELHKILAKPGGVFDLLNQPVRWAAYIQTAKTSLGAAMDMLGNADPGVDPAVGERATRLRELLDRDEADRLLAEKFEKIRMDRSTWIDGKFDLAKARQQYETAFIEAFPGILTDPAEAVAPRIAASPLREHLLASLADWGHVTVQLERNDESLWKKKIPIKLLEIGRRAAPESVWVIQFRAINVYNDMPKLAKLVQEAPITMLSPPILELIGDLLLKEHDPAKRLRWFRLAQAQHPGDFWLNFSLGNVLLEKEPVEAAGFFRAAIAIRPGSTAAYHNLGDCLQRQQKLDEAVAAFQKAIDLDPKSAFGHGYLGFVLMNSGRFAEGLESFKTAIGFLKGNDPFQAKYAAGRDQCAKMLKLEQRVLAVLAGKDAADAGELLQMAVACQKNFRRDAMAAQLYQRAFKAQPALAEDLGKQHRYNAACAAALAGTAVASPPSSDAKGSPKGVTTKEEKAALRRQARDWLQADLDICSQELDARKLEAILSVETRLLGSQVDPAFHRVRGAQALADLPKAERDEWLKFWSAVDRVLQQASSHFVETSTLKGMLTDKQIEEHHEIKLETGKTYVFDMKSTELDSYLKLFDSAGKLVAENDDISYPDNLDSRIIFTPKATGIYRMTATSFLQRGRGAYTLIIRTVAEK
jgi:serine/threonine protein kinase/tetratricopeptide (TPR) repeat protein